VSTTRTNIAIASRSPRRPGFADSAGAPDSAWATIGITPRWAALATASRQPEH